MSPTLSSKSAFFTVKDVANHLGVSTDTIYYMTRNGMPHVRLIGGRPGYKNVRPTLRIPKKEFLDWLKQQGN